MKTKKHSKAVCRAVAEILGDFTMADTMEKVIQVWESIFAEYDLYHDPFTGLPCTSDEYADLNMEYERQMMMERFGHCDGVD